MSATEFGPFTLSLLALIAAAHLFGWAFTRVRQPRVAGEILAGVLLGPAVFGRFAPNLSAILFPDPQLSVLGLKHQAVIGFLFNLGLVLLMFVSGTETKGLFSREDRRQVGWLGGIGTGLPFVVTLAAVPWLPLDLLIGPAQQRTALLLVIAISVAVTSIPVISKIFHDLAILHTRFARLVLGVAVIEDILLWGVLAVATALTSSRGLPKIEIVMHVATALVYFGLGLTLFPYLVRRISNASWNVLARTVPIAYVVVILLIYTAVAAALDVNLVFAAFLAGYALMAEREFADATSTLARVSFAVFIPIYFAVVGYQLDLSRSFSLGMLVIFLALTSAVKLMSAGFGARLAGFPWRDAANLAIALNARGGPGIVVATVAYDARIINAPFYTTLVVVAVLTSQAAGAWLDYVLRKGWPLLTASMLVPAEGVASTQRQPAP